MRLWCLLWKYAVSCIYENDVKIYKPQHIDMPQSSNAGFWSKAILSTISNNKWHVSTTVKQCVFSESAGCIAHDINNNANCMSITKHTILVRWALLTTMTNDDQMQGFIIRKSSDRIATHSPIQQVQNNPTSASSQQFSATFTIPRGTMHRSDHWPRDHDVTMHQTLGQ